MNIFKKINNYLIINGYHFDQKLIKDNDEKSYIEYSIHEQEFIENDLFDFESIFYILKNKDIFKCIYFRFNEFVQKKLYKIQRTKIDSKSKLEHVYNKLLLNIFQHDFTEIKDSKIIFDDKSEIEIIYSSPMNQKLKIIFRTQFQEIRIKDKLFYFRFYLNGIEDEYKLKILDLCFEKIIKNHKLIDYKEYNLNNFRFIKTSDIIYTEFDKLSLIKLKMFKYVIINSGYQLNSIFDNYFQIQFHSMVRIIKFIINHKLLEDLTNLYVSGLDVPPASLNQLSEPEYAKSLVVNNLFFAKKIARYQRIWCGQISSFIRYYVSYDPIFKNALIKTLNAHGKHHAKEKLTEKVQEFVDVSQKDIYPWYAQTLEELKNPVKNEESEQTADAD